MSQSKLENSSACCQDVINAPIEKVWRYIRDFSALASWHPRIKASAIENNYPEDKVGAIRLVILGNNATARERLTCHNDQKYIQSYTFEAVPFPVENYEGTIALTSEDDGHTTFTWSSKFKCPEGMGLELRQMLETEIFSPGIESVKEHFAA